MSTADRLLGSLEDLLQQVDASMRAGEIAAAITVGSRVNPLITRISAQRTEFQDAAAQQRIQAIRARFAALDQWIESRLLEIRMELKTRRVAAHRVAAIAPVYGTLPRPGPTLNAVG